MNALFSARHAFWRAQLSGFVATATLACLLPLHAGSNVTLWDTREPLKVQTGTLTERDAWKPVPRDLFTLEADPPKASSDPGYYGREYTFKGDAVLETRTLVVAIRTSDGAASIVAKGQDAGAAATPLGTIGVVLAKPGPTKLQGFTVIRNAADELVVDAAFSGGKDSEATVRFAVGKDGILEVQPLSGVTQLRVGAPLEYAVVPGFVGDDLLVGGSLLEGRKSVTLPAENMLLGLVRGESAVLTLTWAGEASGGVEASVVTGDSGRPSIDAVQIPASVRSVFVAASVTPGIWHREPLRPDYLEKEVTSKWSRPYPAKWTTQLLEGGVRTSFGFKEAKREIWRGVPGSYNYPAWFEGDTAHFYFGKKIPPKGEAVVYHLEGQDSPADVLTPVDVLKATLGRAASEPILDIAGRKLRTHHRRAGDGVHRACTCGCTEVIQAIFEAGQETRKRETIEGALGDMNFFVEQHVARIDEYQQFARELIAALGSRPNLAPEVKAYADELAQLTQQIVDEYTNQKENMKSAAFASELTRKTLSLTATASTNNLSAYMDLLKAWRGMGGAQDFVIAQCHTLTRKLYQQAGEGVLSEPRALPIAMDVRQRCRKILRSPDGYEIWPEY